MSRHEVYFANHGRALRFPWSLYHRPLLRHLNRSLADLPTGARALAVGPGDFRELPELQARGLRVSVLDIDPRVLETLRGRYGDAIDGYYLEQAPAASFDFLYAKEVVEHVVDHGAFLRQLFGLLAPGGRLWLSTPNYGFFLLPLLERTVLELIARRSGFSRRDIHPSRFGAKHLALAMQRAGLARVEVDVVSWAMALAATAARA